MYRRRILPAAPLWKLLLTCWVVVVGLLMQARPISAQAGAVGPGEAALDPGEAVELTDEQARRAEGLVNNFMSPFCPGRTLAGCPSPSAGQWRQEIRRWVKEGASNAEIQERLARRVPGFNLAGSPSSPVGRWLAVIIAAVFVTVLVVVLRRLVRKGSKVPLEPQRTKATSDGEKLDSHLDSRLDRELEALD
jgi:cytochrome c-type biogenesis protein CcmH/NrfF